MSEEPLTEREIMTIKRYLSDPTAFPTIFRNWITMWTEVNPPAIPISQVQGFAQFTPYAVRLDAESSWDNTTYGDPNLSGPAGPTLTGLPAGKYVVHYGAGIQAEGAQTIFITLAPNGVVPVVDDNSIESLAPLLVPAATSYLVDLTAEVNTLKMVFRCGGATGHTGRRRWIVAYKYSN